MVSNSMVSDAQQEIVRHREAAANPTPFYLVALKLLESPVDHLHNKRIGEAKRRQLIVWGLLAD